MKLGAVPTLHFSFTILVKFTVLLALAAPMGFGQGPAEESMLTVYPPNLRSCIDSLDSQSIAVNMDRNPYFLRLDLDGDGGMEYVVQIAEPGSGKATGVMIYHSAGNLEIFRSVQDGILSERQAKGTYTVYFEHYERNNVRIHRDKPVVGIPIGPEWFELSRQELVELLGPYGIVANLSKIRGEGITSLWPESQSVAFRLDGKLRWVLVTVADPEP